MYGIDGRLMLPAFDALQFLVEQRGRDAQAWLGTQLSANNLFDFVALRHASFLKEFAPLSGPALSAAFFGI